MTAVSLLLILLLVAFVGGQWSSDGRRGALGTASGIEYVLLGLVLGPSVLGTLDSEVLLEFEPVSLLALGWIALGYGVDCGSDQQLMRPKNVLLSTTVSACLMGASAVCIYWLTPSLDVRERLKWSACLGLVAASSARDAVRAAIARCEQKGALCAWLQRTAVADDAPALLALPFVFAWFHPAFSVHGLPVPAAVMAACALALGLLLGLMVAWLTARSHAEVERWTLLLGSAWLATGLSDCLGLGAMGVCFALGLALSAGTADSGRLRQSLDATDGSVVPPALVLAGAHLSAPRGEMEWAVLAAALLVRVALGALLNRAIAGRAHPKRQVRTYAGLSLLSASTLNPLVGFAILLHFGDDVGRTALSAACLGALAGEILGSWSLRKAMVKAGEWTAAPPAAGHAGANEVAP